MPRSPRLLPVLAVALAAASCDHEPPRERTAPGAVGEGGVVGTWRLDAETREWLPRACVRLDFPNPDDASFEVVETGGETVVRLNTPHRTAWRVRPRAGGLVGQQILPTSPSGRFCGRETTVALRIREARPGVLTGAWTTPGCDVCPDRPFGAIRVGG